MTTRLSCRCFFRVPMYILIPIVTSDEISPMIFFTEAASHTEIAQLFKTKSLSATSFIPLGNSGPLTLIRLQQLQRQCYLFRTVHAVFSYVQTKVWLPMLWIFSVCMDVNARDCRRGLYKHCKRVY